MATKSPGHDHVPVIPPPTAKFNWNCCTCGYQWKDDGVYLPAIQNDDLPGK